MKKINLLLLAAAAAGLIQASPVGSAAGHSPASIKLCVSFRAAAPDTAFASKAAIGGMAEVALGKMAAVKGASSKVKDFGKMMVQDHGKANAELKAIAQSENIALPAGLDAEHQAKSKSLGQLSGADFDKAYVQMMIEDHKATLALMQTEASTGTDAKLKAFAAKTAPVVQMHLAEITKIQAAQ